MTLAPDYDEEEGEAFPPGSGAQDAGGETGDAELLALTRPLARLAPGDPSRSLAEVASALHAFADAAALLNLPPGARVLDAGCGAGWVSHWLARLGYRTLGVDASDDAVDLARTRIAGDPNLESELEEIDGMFLAHDLGAEPLPEEAGRFAAALFMHGFTGFADRAAALAHAAEALDDTGVVLILGRPDWTREAQDEALDAAGLAHRRYLGAVQGWYAGILGGAEGCLAAATAEALARVAPPEPEPAPPPVSETPAALAPAADEAWAPKARPSFLARLMSGLRGRS